MAYKLLVMDLDGTLTNTQKVITPQTMKALTAAQEAGVRLVLASGRGNPAGEVLATHRLHAAKLVKERLQKQSEQRHAQREADALARQHAQKLGQLVEKFGRHK